MDLIETNAGLIAEQDLERHEQYENLPQGNKCLTRSYYLKGQLVRRDIQIIVTPEGLAALGLTLEDI